MAGRKRSLAKLKVEQSGDTERPRLLAYLAEPTSSQHLRRVLQGAYIVVECGSAEEVERELTGRLYAGLLIGRFHKDGTSCIDFVQRVRRKFPSVAIVLYSVPAPSLFHEIVDFSRAGIDEVVLRGADDMRRILARTVAMAAEAALVHQAMAVLEPLLTPNVQRLVRACLAQSDGHIGVASLARALRVTRKTLANWCRDASTPSPEAMVGWDPRTSRGANARGSRTLSRNSSECHALRFGECTRQHVPQIPQGKPWCGPTTRCCESRAEKVGGALG